MVFPAAASGGLENFVPANVYEGQFSDVPAGAWFYENVSAVYELGLMQGESDTYFNADGNLSIAEAVAMAARLHSIYKTGEEHFVQDETCWYQVYVDYARKNGIINEDYENITKAATRAEYRCV